MRIRLACIAVALVGLVTLAGCKTKSQPYHIGDKVRLEGLLLMESDFLKSGKVPLNEPENVLYLTGRVEQNIDPQQIYGYLFRHETGSFVLYGPEWFGGRFGEVETVGTKLLTLYKQQPFNPEKVAIEGYITAQQEGYLHYDLRVTSMRLTPLQSGGEPIILTW